MRNRYSSVLFGTDFTEAPDGGAERLRVAADNGLAIDLPKVTPAGFAERLTSELTKPKVSIEQQRLEMARE